MAEGEEFERAPFDTTTAEGWKKFAAGMSNNFLGGYKSGEMDFRELMKAVQVFSKYCEDPFRRSLLGYIAECALEIEPKYLGARKPKFPACFKKSLIELVLMLEESSEPLDHAMQWLKPFKRYDPPSIRTLRDWVTKHKKKNNLPAGKRGRPRKPRA
ncbi:MAG: hypothetical protein ACYDHY_01095 [Acidiferrobacterales bacterium]